MASTRTRGERSAMIRATASSEAVSVSIRKSGFTRRRIANPARGRAQKQFSPMARSPGESPYAKGYGKSDTEDMYDHADNHHLHGKRTLGGSGEWHHDAVHEEISGHAIKSTKNDCVLYQGANSAARYKKDRSRSICDDEVTKKPKQRRHESAVERLRPEQPAGNSLQQAHRLEAQVSVDDERSRNVQDAARKPGPQHCKHSVWVFLQENLRCCVTKSARKLTPQTSLFR